MEGGREEGRGRRPEQRRAPRPGPARPRPPPRGAATHTGTCPLPPAGSAAHTGTAPLPPAGVRRAPGLRPVPREAAEQPPPRRGVADPLLTAAAWSAAACGTRRGGPRGPPSPLAAPQLGSVPLAPASLNLFCLIVIASEGTAGSKLREQGLEKKLPSPSRASPLFLVPPEHSLGTRLEPPAAASTGRRLPPLS